MGNNICCQTNCNQLAMMDNSMANSPRVRAQNRRQRGREMQLISQDFKILTIEELEGDYEVVQKSIDSSA